MQALCRSKSVAETKLRDFPFCSRVLLFGERNILFYVEINDASVKAENVSLVSKHGDKGDEWYNDFLGLNTNRTRRVKTNYTTVITGIQFTSCKPPTCINSRSL